jgi:hypothetical protein
MVLVAAVCFGGLRDHGVFFHDDETFRDNKILAEDLAFFFSAEREHRAGRSVASLIKWWSFTAVGNEPGAAHVVAVVGHTMASIWLAWVCNPTGLTNGGGVVGGGLFLVNVAHFQAVFHISALDFLLALMLSLTSWSLHRASAESHRPPGTRKSPHCCVCSLPWPVILLGCRVGGVGLRDVLEEWWELATGTAHKRGFRRLGDCDGNAAAIADTGENNNL